MLSERSADFGAESGHDIDYAFGNAGIGQGLNQVEGGERSVLRRFNYAGVAANDGRQQLPRGDSHGKIPGRDHAADSDGLADGHGELVGQFGGYGGTEQAAAFAGVVVGGIDPLLDIASSFFQHLAHFASHVTGIIFLTFDQDFGSAKDH